jgi:hypothetical protein
MLKKYAPPTVQNVEDMAWLNDPELVAQSDRNWSQALVNKRREKGYTVRPQNDMKAAGRLSVRKKREKNPIINFSNNVDGREVNIGRITRIFWTDSENNNQEKILQLTFPIPGGGKKNVLSVVYITYEGIEFQPKASSLNKVSIPILRFEIYQQSQDIHRMWQLEHAKKYKLDIPPPRVTFPPIAGQLFPTNRDDNIKSFDLSSIRQGDSMFILQQFYRTIPANILVICFTPAIMYQAYNEAKTKSKENKTFRPDQVLYFYTEYKNFLQDNYTEHPRVGESLWMLEEYNNTNAGYPAHFMYLLGRFFVNRNTNIGTAKFKYNDKLKQYKELRLD